MKKYVVLEKPIGQTPLEAIQEWREKNPRYKDVPASYAGRLDPMASGKLLILLGEECKRQKEYTKLDKEYEVEILLDIGSDTSDILGLVTLADKETHPADTAARAVLNAERGTHERAYPIFSSKTVRGKPLFLYVLENTLHTISIPTHSETLYKISLISLEEISTHSLRQRVEKTLELAPRSDEPSKTLGADFRIDAVQATWKKVFESAGTRTFTILRLRVICASGSYMRSLAGRIGVALGTDALALSIHRRRIGSYRDFGPLGIWTKIVK